MARRSGRDVLGGDKPLSFQLSEIGYNGLKVTNGRIQEELKRELEFPHSVITYKQMGYDSAVASALSYYEHMMLKAAFTFKPHQKATEEEKEYATFMKECMDDMDHSWQDFIQEVSSMNTYGFCVNEIVLRLRKRSKGSKYNDGKVGIKKLPIRSQDSISEWEYNDDNDLIGLKQKVAKLTRSGGINMRSLGEEFRLPREKFLLFRLGKKKDSPVGESPLKACYYAWKYKTTCEELESVID